jgi:CheY-like chemotaxis protein
VKVDEIIRKVIESHQKSLQQRHVVADVVTTGTLPQVEGDPRLLTQVFANILVNAEQAISSVREKGTIRISLSLAGNNLLVVFADDGPGIPQEMVDQIYDPFFTTKRPGGGSGLGLTICLAVIKDHGGRIEVQTSEGAGATFRIFLPAIVQKKLEAPNSTSARNASPVSLSLSGRKLLIVDDEESIREIVQDGLSARGMTVECAGSSEEALALLAGNTYDIVLCDFNLPGLRGEQLFERLRTQSESSVPRFVFITGDLLEPSTIASFAERGAHVLQKPFHISALATLLSEFLQEQPVKAN